MLFDRRFKSQQLEKLLQRGFRLGLHVVCVLLLAKSEYTRLGGKRYFFFRAGSAAGAGAPPGASAVARVIFI